MEKILVTGANGFVGKRLCQFLSEKGLSIKAALRSTDTQVIFPSNIEKVILGPLEEWGNLEVQEESGTINLLSDVDTIVHLAARVHMMHEISRSPLDAYRQVNVLATEALAKLAAKAKVRRFIYLSSIKVNGESTDFGQWFSETDVPNPQDPYAQSKWEAEQVLYEIAKKTALEVVIIRPPLVYGKGVKANFQNLIQWVQKGFPIPLGAVHNKRSLIYVDNLVDSIFTCMQKKEARNQTYFVSDGEDISTPDLIRHLAKVLRRPARLLPISPKLLNLFGKAIRKQATVERLLSSLCVSNQKICHELNWRPPYKMEEAFHRDFAKVIYN